MYVPQVYHVHKSADFDYFQQSSDIDKKET